MLLNINIRLYDLNKSSVQTVLVFSRDLIALALVHKSHIKGPETLFNTYSDLFTCVNESMYACMCYQFLLQDQLVEIHLVVGHGTENHIATPPF
jgi:hypothetical protein